MRCPTGEPDRPARSAATRCTMTEGAGDHVDISPERDALPRSPAAAPQPGSETSWRSTPQCAVTLIVLGAVLLVCLGLLLGTTWTIQALQHRLRQQAEERRRLNAEWSAVRTARQQRGTCPHCASPLSERDWSVAPRDVVDPPDDDD